MGPYISGLFFPAEGGIPPPPRAKKGKKESAGGGKKEHPPKRTLILIRKKALYLRSTLMAQAGEETEPRLESLKRRRQSRPKAGLSERSRGRLHHYIGWVGHQPWPSHRQTVIWPIIRPIDGVHRVPYGNPSDTR